MATVPAVTTEVSPAPVAKPGSHRLPKLPHLQILRAVAASLVVADHVVGALSALGAPSQRFSDAGHLMGFAGVAAFFVLSGFIMVRQSDSLFALPGGARQFAIRRLTRIVPLYWVATLLWAVSPFHRATPFMRKELLLSLSFIPDFLSKDPNFGPVLAQGWTLNYEMAFYFLFFIALFFHRRNGILILIFLPQVLVAIGHSHILGSNAVLPAIANFYCDPVILYFTLGVILGYVEFAEIVPRGLRMPFSPAWLLLIPPALLMLIPTRVNWTNSSSLLGIYAALVVVASTLVHSEPKGAMERAAVRLGDASYSTYLFHAYVYAPVVLTAVHLWGHRPASTLFVIVCMVACVVAANLLGLLAYRYIERSIGQGLRRLSA